MKNKLYLTITLAAVAFAVGFTFYNVFKAEDALLRENVRALAQSRSCHCAECEVGYVLEDGCCVLEDRGSAVRSGGCRECEEGYALDAWGDCVLWEGGLVEGYPFQFCFQEQTNWCVHACFQMLNGIQQCMSATNYMGWYDCCSVVNACIVCNVPVAAMDLSSLSVSNGYYYLTADYLYNAAKNCIQPPYIMGGNGHAMVVVITDTSDPSGFWVGIYDPNYGYRQEPIYDDGGHIAFY